jgi:uncharacterized protein DUF4390
MTTSRLTALFLALALAAGGAAVRAAETIHITPIVRDSQVLVSFELSDAYNDAIRETIASGLRTTFTYELELRTIVPSWIDRTIAGVVVSVSDQYDNLTRRHTLSRSVDGRLEDVTVTENDAVVRTWLTSWTRLPLCPTSKLDQTRDYYVRVTARTRPHGGSLLGLARTVTGQTRFTFVP